MRDLDDWIIEALFTWARDENGQLIPPDLEEKKPILDKRQRFLLEMRSQGLAEWQARREWAALEDHQEIRQRAFLAEQEFLMRPEQQERIRREMGIR
jgi:hypothetical protein